MDYGSRAVLRGAGLCKEFGPITAVRNLDLELYPGEVLGFLGPNGSGKSTTIGLLLGLIAPTAGQVELFGKPLERCGTAEFRRVGAVLETQPLYPFLSGRDNLEVQARLLDMDSNRIDELLALVGLGERAHSKASTYSQGMKQRLSLAGALLPDPDILIFDEPTNGMDPSGMMEVRELIRELGKQGKAVFLSSHLLHEVEQVSTRVMIIKEGEVLAQGRVKELLQRGNVLQIRVAETQQALDIIKGLSQVQSVSQEGDLLRVEVPQERAREISAALAQKGIFPSEMRYVESSLEEFFQEITKEGEERNP